MADGRQFEIQSIDSLSLLLIFTPNLLYGLKITFQTQFYLQILLLKKSKMAANAILNFCLMATTRSLLHALAHNLTQRLKLTSRTELCLQSSLLRQQSPFISLCNGYNLVATAHIRQKLKVIYRKYRVAQKKRPEHLHALCSKLLTDF